MAKTKPPIRIISQESFEAAYQQHQLWLADPEKGQRMDFSGCDLSQLTMPVGMALSGASFIGAYLLSGLTFDETIFNTDMRSGSGLESQIGNFCNREIPGLHVPGADFTDAFLMGATFNRGDLRGTKWVRAELGVASFTQCDLRGADLTDAVLGDAVLEDSDLSNATCRGSHLYAAVLTGTKLTNTNLENADLRHALNIRLDASFVRGTRFVPIASRWWSFTANRFGSRSFRVQRILVSLGLLRQMRVLRVREDPWSVLRQTYSGPRLAFLLLTLVAFALPYVGRAVFWGAIGQVEHSVTAKFERDREAEEAKIAARLVVIGPAAVLIERKKSDAEEWLARHTEVDPIVWTKKEHSFATPIPVLLTGNFALASALFGRYRHLAE